MTAQRDVAARLSEGRPAVEHTQTYVAACQVLGYQDADLTAHAAQVRDWYETEAGLDLPVLDDDCAALWSTVSATEQALATQRAQLTELAAAWRGPGADCAMRFLQRHCDSAAAVAARVRAAAEGCSALRDNLWHLVDAKVATAIAIDDRRLADRPAWLAAAQTVTSGVGDRSFAEELIRQQVNPYVDNDIRINWLAAMRSTVVSVDTAFDAVIDGLAAMPDGCFEMVGDLGPSATMATTPMTAPATDTVATLPAAAPPPLPTPPLPPPPLPPPPPPPPADTALPPPTDPLGDGIGLPSGMGDFGGAGGLGGLAGSIGGVVGSIIDGIGGLVGSLADGLADPGLDDSAPEDPFDEKEDDEEAAEDDEPVDEQSHDEDAAPPDESAPATTDVVDAPAVPEDTAAPVEPAPAAPVAEAPPPAPPAPPEEKTPCEIAADELPQAGQ